MSSIISPPALLKTIMLELGVWNMDASNSKIISFSTVPKENVRELSAIIFNDSGQAFSFESAMNGSETNTNYIAHTGSNFQLNRANGGYFDGTGYNDTVMNRGYLILKHV